MFRFGGAALAAIFALTGVSCTTSYDAYGRPRQSVDPGVAVAGAAAAGLIGYAAGRDRDRDRSVRHHYYHPAPRRYYRAPGRYYRY